MMRNAFTNRKDQNGYVVAFVVISLGAMLTIMGFAVDVGAWYFNASKLQRAADAAALSGAISLPRQEQAAGAVDKSLQKNSYVDADSNIVVTREITPDRVTVTVKNKAVPTYFTSAFLDKITIERTSSAVRATSIPALGSPYNILGAGSQMSLSGAVRNQGFWLSINGECTPAEDGDYFNARWDANKGPFTGDQDGNGFFIPKDGAEHQCNKDHLKNNNHDAGGYNYFVDVPAPGPGHNDAVWLRVFDGSWYPGGAGNFANDSNLALPGEKSPGWPTNFTIWDTNDTPDMQNDDHKLKTIQIMGYDSKQIHTDVKGWVGLYKIPYNDIKNRGGQYRIQVTTETPTGHGINNFALGAFRGWNDWTDCDSREVSDCPRVYARHALSITNNTTNNEKNPKMYLAELDATYVGTPFQIFMWDPGEGVKSINLLAPDDTKLDFKWRTADGDYDSNGQLTNNIDTSGDGNKAKSGLSNKFKFNDRLVVLDVVLPADYQAMVDAAGGSTWLRLQYNIDGNTPQDRTTVGVQLTGGQFGPARIVRPES